MKTRAWTEQEHDALRELVPFYALGVLSSAESEVMEAHAGVCSACADELRRMTAVASELPLALPSVSPSRRLRARVVEAVAARQPIAIGPVAGARLAAAALLVVGLSFAFYVGSLRARLEAVETALRDAERRLDGLAADVGDSNRVVRAAEVRTAILTAPDAADVRLGAQIPGERAEGRAVWSRSRGLMFAVANLPVLPQGRTYQLWYLTDGPPVSAGLVRPDSSGGAVVIAGPTAGRVDVTGFAVSLEPEGGVAAPTGPIYLAGRL